MKFKFIIYLFIVTCLAFNQASYAQDMDNDGALDNVDKDSDNDGIPNSFLGLIFSLKIVLHLKFMRLIDYNNQKQNVFHRKEAMNLQEFNSF